MTNTFSPPLSPAVESYNETLRALLKDPKSPYALIQHERAKQALSDTDYEHVIPIVAGAMFGTLEELPRFVAYQDLVEILSRLSTAAPDKTLQAAETVAERAAQRQHLKKDNLKILAETLRSALSGNSARRHIVNAIQRLPGPSSTRH